MLASCSPRCLQPWPSKKLHFLSNSNPKTKSPHSFLCPNPRVNCALGLRFEDVAAIAHNKVLVAAGLSGAIGQLSKPFTSVVLYKRPFSFKAAVQAGGFPSTHSSVSEPDSTLPCWVFLN